MNQLRKNVIIAFVFAAFALLTVTVISYRSINKFIENSRWLDHTNKVLLDLETLMNLIKESESSYRGLLLIGDKDFIKKYDSIPRHLQERYEHLHFLLRDNRLQDKRLEVLWPVVMKKYEVMNKSISMFRSKEDDKKAALALLKDSKHLMDVITVLINQMIRAEKTYLVVRTEEQEMSASSTLWAIIILSFSAMLISVAAFWRINADNVEKTKAKLDLEMKVAALNRSNYELEQFAYAASHDLQEPLRKVRAFGDRLQHRYAKHLDDTGKDYIMRMQGAAERMQNLIEDLLTYSRINKKEKGFERTNMSEVLKDILSDISELTRRTHAHITYDELPVIEAIPSLIGQLLQNLIINAIKFRKENTEPVIHISSSIKKGKELDQVSKIFAEKEYARIAITDNGIGFDEKYADKIFVIFQRLHGRTEFEGSGIGLAVCKRICEKHHGYISAYSKVGKGATFVIVLPLVQIWE